MPKPNRGIHVKPRKERGTWEVVESIRGKLKRHAVGFSSRSEAEENLAEIIIARTRPKRHSNDITLGQVIAYYVEHHAPTVASPENIYYITEKKLAPFWGDIKLYDVNKDLCLQYRTRRKEQHREWRAKTNRAKKELSNETVRRELETLQASISFFRNEGFTALNPPVWKPDKSAPKTRYLTGREAAKLIRKSHSLKYGHDYMPLYILLSLYTGARKSAVLSLRWPQVDLVNEIIDFRSHYKSKIKRGAVVPIPKRLLRELKKTRKRGTDLGYVIHRNQKPLGDIKKGFKECCNQSGLENVTPHTLRHTCASWFMQKGFPSAKIAKWLGTTPQMVERTYGHLAPEHLEELKKGWG